MTFTAPPEGPHLSKVFAQVDDIQIQRKVVVLVELVLNLKKITSNRMNCVPFRQLPTHNRSPTGPGASYLRCPSQMRFYLWPRPTVWTHADIRKPRSIYSLRKCVSLWKYY